MNIHVRLTQSFYRSLLSITDKGHALYIVVLNPGPRQGGLNMKKCKVCAFLATQALVVLNLTQHLTLHRPGS